MTRILNTRILASLAMIVFVGAIAASGTGAFFSDTETSTGNTFTAGDIDLQIDNTSYVNDCNILFDCQSIMVLSTTTSWTVSNLTNQLFFRFIDLKPGDIGEDTISVHVGSNDAWACMALDVTATPENSLVDPETDAADVGPANGDNGELQNYLHFTFWEDDGDNVFETGETVISSLDNVLASTLQGQWHVLADSANGPAYVGNSTNYVGKAWCFGTLAQAPVTQDGVNTGSPLTRGTGFTCSGAGAQNDAQTDGIVADVSFQAIQSRNNGQFLCSGLPTFVGQNPNN